MRYLFLISTGMFLFAAVLAQNLPEGASPLAGGVYDTATNVVTDTGAALQKTPQQSSPLMLRPDGGITNEVSRPGISLQNTPQEVFPLVTEAYKETVPVAPQTGTGLPAGQTNISRVNFLVDAGLQYTDEGEYKSAEQAYLRALEAAPGDPGVRFRLGTLYIQMKRYKEAADVLSSLAADFPGNPMVHNNLAWIYSTGEEVKSGKLALRHAREALLAAPTQASMWNTLAEAYYVSGQYDKALRSSEYAADLLRMQNGAEADVAAFEAQRAKIRRAEEAGRKLPKTGGEK